MSIRFLGESPLIGSLQTVTAAQHSHHSGLLTCDGMSILDADTFRVEAVEAIIVDYSGDPAFPVVTPVSVVQTDHTILGGGDQVLFVYITALGVYEIRIDAPSLTSITDEIYLGKIAMLAGVIVTASFAPIVSYTGSVDEIMDLIGLGGRNTVGSEISAAGANLTLGLTAGDHTQLGRAFLTNPNAPNQCGTPADAVAGFTGANSRLFLVYQDAGGILAVDADVTGANPAINTNQFNSAGTLTVMSPNNFQALRVVQFCESNFVVVYYGKAEYANLAAARLGYESELWEAEAESKDGSLIAIIFIKKGITDLTAAIIASDAEIINRAGARDPRG